jgi:penicillin-binding protein activator
MNLIGNTKVIMNSFERNGIMKRLLILSVAALLMTAACKKGEVRRIDPDKTENVTIDWGRTDIQETVDVMVKDLLAKCGADLTGRPYIAVDRVANQSGEFIDTKNITDLVRSKLMDSGQFRFTTERKDRKALLTEVDEQEESGLYKDNGRRAKKGNWIPPEYIMRGRVSSISKRNDDVRDVYYQITLQMESINEAAFVWSKTSKIAKQQDR